jgi:hypothetical protein
VLIRGYFRDGVADTNFHELLRISTNGFHRLFLGFVTAEPASRPNPISLPFPPQALLAAVPEAVCALTGQACSVSIPVMNWLVAPRAKPRGKDRTRGAGRLQRREASRLYGDCAYPNHAGAQGDVREIDLLPKWRTLSQSRDCTRDGEHASPLLTLFRRFASKKSFLPQRMQHIQRIQFSA